MTPEPEPEPEQKRGTGAGTGAGPVPSSSGASMADESNLSSSADPDESTDLDDAPPFPPVARSHIVNCGLPEWYPRYRLLTPKTRLVPLTRPVLDYLRRDGIMLPPDEPAGAEAGEGDGASDGDTQDKVLQGWEEVHSSIQKTIADLGGAVLPKLNWSSPKDASWMMPMHSMVCRSASDVYLLLKSSDFVTHDLENVFDHTYDDRDPQAREAAAAAADADDTVDRQNGIRYSLGLRKAVTAWNPALEFRCFVRARSLIGVSARDETYYDYLFRLRPKLGREIIAFFHSHLQYSFPDDSFTFDVYVPRPYDRVWLVDINPWAPRTDPLLFDWPELVRMEDRHVSEADYAGLEGDEDGLDDRPDARAAPAEPADGLPATAVVDSFDPFFRLVRRGPDGRGRTGLGGGGAAAAPYSAHRLPRDVVDAAAAGGGGVGAISEFATSWFAEVRRREERRKHGLDSEESSEEE